MIEIPMVCLSQVTDPWWNLAAEQHFLVHEPVPEPLLMIWQSDPSVIIGRYQNPWVECDTDILSKESVLLARRPSGGGAVYHDLGNLNYTLITRRASYSKHYMLEFIISVLKSFSIEALASGRSDMTAKGKKFSGNAFKFTTALVLHHGTLLVSADLGKMRRCLTPERRIDSMKGIRSQASEVVNLAELAQGLSCSELALQLARTFPSWFGGDPEVQELSPSHIELDEQRNELSSWEWTYGKTPEFTRSFTLPGSARASVTVSKGIITDISADGMGGAEKLIGRRYDEQELKAFSKSQ